MTRTMIQARQGGVALFLSLIMLLVLTVLGISSFQNSHMQERSAGNARLQSVAFEAAAAGASNAINFFDSNRDLGPDQLCGSLDHPGWDDPTAWVDMGNIGGAGLKQRMYCLADAYPCTVDNVDCDARPPRSQLFVLSRGEITSGGDVVALRDVEVRLAVTPAWGVGGGCGAICFPGCESGTLYFPNSEDFYVDGNGGPAITGGCQEMAYDISDAIRDNRIGNYLGGVVATSPESPWDSAENVEAFRANVEATAMASQSAGTCMTFCYNPGDVFIEGEHLFGTDASPQVTYIHGNAEIGGQVAGVGVLVVNGTLSWHGQPNWRGLIVTLGGHMHVEGHGEQGGDPGGSLVILNAPGDGTLGPAGFYNEGGGEGHYSYNCQHLLTAQSLLDAEGQALWSPECAAAPGNPFEAGLDDVIIASWRENVGWREDFFGSTP